MTNWQECKLISELPEVDEALRLFAEGETTEDQAVAIVQAILQAAQQPSGDVVRDAKRYRFLAERCRSASEHWGGRWWIVIDGPAPKSHDSEDDFDAAIDAAMAPSARKAGGE